MHMLAEEMRSRACGSRIELALRVVARNYIFSIGLGKNSPRVRLTFKLCDALDLTPSKLMKDLERRMQVQGPR